jgi:copper chaperone CopZ
MKTTLEVINVKCGGCAGTLKKALNEEFGEVEINLEVMPRQITLNIEESQKEALALKLKQLGYPLASENLNTMEKITTTAKSFVSCAVGKMDN